MSMSEVEFPASVMPSAFEVMLLLWTETWLVPSMWMPLLVLLSILVLLTSAFPSAIVMPFSELNATRLFSMMKLPFSSVTPFVPYSTVQLLSKTEDSAVPSSIVAQSPGLGSRLFEVNLMSADSVPFATRLPNTIIEKLPPNLTSTAGSIVKVLWR